METKKRKKTKSSQYKNRKPLYQEMWEALVAPIARVFESYNIRYFLLGVVFIVFLIIALIRILLFITGGTAQSYRNLGNQINRPTPISISPVRGAIYSSDNRPIAVTAPMYRLHFDFAHPILAGLHKEPKTPQEVLDRDSLQRRLNRDLDSLLSQLTEAFAKDGVQVDKSTVQKRWRAALQKKSRYCAVVNLDISYLRYKEMMAREPMLGPIVDTLKNKRGISLLRTLLTPPKEISKRINPFGSLALRTIGSVYGEMKDGLSVGKQGLEAGFNKDLQGVKGKGLAVHVAGTSRKETLVKLPAQDGYSVYTTLDMNIQSQLERIMRAQLTKFSAQSGTAILLDVPTGRVLAMTNLFKNKQGYSEDRNFAITDMSEPGSTFKVASMLVALDNNFVKPKDTIDVGNGLWEVGGRTVRDHNAHHGGYGRLSVSQVIERSSNVGVAKIIQKNFKDKPSSYVQQVRDLAFGHDLRVEIPGAEQARIRMPKKETWYGTTLAWMSFGYETQIPPMYTAAFFNAIANGGKLMKPYLVREIRDKEGTLIRRIDPQVVKAQIAKPSSISAIQDMLRKVVTDGTGKKLNSSVVAISGKSGTAQIAKAGGYRGPDGVSHQVSFCGYFPSEAPRYTLMVVIREPSKEFAAGGGSMAGPVVKELAETIISMEQVRDLEQLKQTQRQPNDPIIGRKQELEFALKSSHIKFQSREDISKDAYIRVDRDGRESLLTKVPKNTIPNLIGMTASDAHYYLRSLGYKVRLRGYGRVVEQRPEAGTKVKPATLVNLSLQM